MMRNTITILIICAFLGCNTNQKKKIPELENTISTDKVESKTLDSNLDGVWGLNNYFDNILADKEIAKYRIPAPTWFAILLEIKNDSLISYGSIIELEEKLNFNSDTLAVFNSFSGKYALFKKSNELHLKQFPNQDIIDSTTYIFRKRNDLKNLLEDKDRVHKISSNITKYFNENLISGVYENKKNKEIITFKKNGDLINFTGFDKYEVRNYFGTLHPHKNLDVITFTNSKQNDYKQFNWKFENKKLILTEFVHEKVDYKGKKEITDDFVLGKKVIELINRKNH
ncbi:hypothetical protein [Flavivirga spongiicola]|uniref:DUF4292 domain-containing protein n=1 Tax=Flavivirga spongiicola TaxID=421621 RepID=A0ABU7XNH7_9FLAO|nr:hypothetical protein [Flavivirga sp. MEBiC05379]MDO5981755.1 hypothetical protein [Flavivirga sp. MEBiC05379]